MTIVVKMVGKNVAKKEEMWTYIKARSKIGCSLKQIFAEISVYVSTNVSYDMVLRWKKKFDSWLRLIKNAPKYKGPKSTYCVKLYQKKKKLLI